MTGLLEASAALAVVVAGIAVMTGILPPGEALRRTGAALVLLLFIPVFAKVLLQMVLGPLAATLEMTMKLIGWACLAIFAMTVVGYLVLQLRNFYLQNRGE
ncbi:MAG: hypothetical protein AB7O65_08690 [Candidatus Korobacteraceae bacterium]